MMRKWTLATLVLFALLAPSAHAQVRAWLDRDRIEAGETTTLNIAADSAQGGPDYAAVARSIRESRAQMLKTFEANPTDDRFRETMQRTCGQAIDAVSNFTCR